MFRHYLITAFRNIRKQPVFSFLNILALSLGMSSCFIIFLVLKFEFSYDEFYKNADRIVRVGAAREGYNSCVSLGVAPAIEDYFPEVKKVVTVWPLNSDVLTVGNKKFAENSGLYVDADFASVFEQTWIRGDKKTALLNPNSVVLTKSLSERLFGSSDVVGKNILVGKGYHHPAMNVMVTGVIEDPPVNTHLSFSFLVSYESIRKDLAPVYYDFYTIVGAYTYCLLDAPEDIISLQDRMDKFMSFKWGAQIAKENDFVLQPVSEIHFDTRFQGAASKNTYWSLCAIAVLILLMACMNFVNLSTAISMRRAKEIGIRKTLGSQRRQLILQFLGETGLLVSIALIVSVFFCAWFISVLAGWIDMKLDAAVLVKPKQLVGVITFSALLVLIAGLYPAFVQSAFNPLKALKNKGLDSNERRLGFRNALLLFQFVISQVLITATIIVAVQLNYLKEQDLGFVKEAVVSLPRPDASKQEKLRQLLSNDVGVSDFSFSSGAPSFTAFYVPLQCKEVGVTKAEVAEMRYVDERYLDLFDLKLIAGEKIKPLSGNYITFRDTMTERPVLVNEVLVHRLGFKSPEDALGRSLTIYWNYRAVIKGVVKDFQSESRHLERKPCLFNYVPDNFLTASVKLRGPGMHETIERLGKGWAGLFPDEIFRYEFLDEHIAAQYKAENRQLTIFRIFSVLAIVIGCLGLYGLVSFSASARIKEIGIRKVLGAKVLDIVTLLSSRFFVLIITALLIAIPITWYFMSRWLESFVYHITLSWWMFVVAGLFALFISALTISHQSLRAAFTNPVKSLRTE